MIRHFNAFSLPFLEYVLFLGAGASSSPLLVMANVVRFAASREVHHRANLFLDLEERISGLDWLGSAIFKEDFSLSGINESKAPHSLLPE